MMRAAKSVSRMVVGMTMATTIASRQPIDNGDQHNDRDRGQAEVKQQLVGLFVGGLAIVAGDIDRDIIGNDLALELGQARR